MFDKNKIKVITLDFDGTVLQKDKMWLSPRNHHALKECQKRGIHCVPCTGRTADMFPPQFEDGSFRYWFSCFGARILDTLTGEVIHKHSFTPEQSAEICRMFEGKGIYCEVAAEGKLFFEKEIMDNLWKYPVPPHHVWYMYTSGRPVTVYGKLSDFFLSQNIGAEKFNLYGIPEKEFQPMLEKAKSFDFAGISLSDPVGIQISDDPKLRVPSMEILLDRLGCTWENVMSIGDGMALDSLMIRKAAFGVTLENAPDELKQIADYVTDRYDEDGFAKVVEKFIL
jgi:hypothetical protein